MSDIFHNRAARDWFELTSLLVQALSRAPHIENLKSTPCGQFYFNFGGLAFPLVFDRIKVLVAVAIQRADYIL